MRTHGTKLDLWGQVWERPRTEGAIDVVIFLPNKPGRRDVTVRRTPFILILVTDTEVILIEKG